jgi:hypothetical protein
MNLNEDSHFKSARGYHNYNYVCKKIHDFADKFSAQDAMFIIVRRDYEDGSHDFVPVFSVGKHSTLIRVAAENNFYVIN